MLFKSRQLWWSPWQSTHRRWCQVVPILIITLELKKKTHSPKECRQCYFESTCVVTPYLKTPFWKILFFGLKRQWKTLGNQWIQWISHTKSHESDWKSNGFKAFLTQNLSWIPFQFSWIPFFLVLLPIIWGWIPSDGSRPSGGDLFTRTWHSMGDAFHEENG